MKKQQNKLQKPFYSIQGNLAKVAMLFLLIALIFPALAFSKNDNMSWKLNASVNNVDFYYSISTCNGKKVVFLKFINKNRGPVTIAFKKAIKTSEGTEETTFDKQKKLVIQPGETMAEDCTQNICKDCVVLPEIAIPSHHVDVKDFQFKDIQVTVR